MKKQLLIYTLVFLAATRLPANDPINYNQLLKLSCSELESQGNKYKKYNKLDSAMKYYIVLAGKYNKNMEKTDKYLCASAFDFIGQVYYQKENYSKAFEAYLKGVQISEENEFEDLLAELYNNIGNIYGIFADYEQAINYHEKALSYAEKHKNTTIEIKPLANLIGSCCFANQTSKAKIYYNKLIKYLGKDKLIEYFGYFGKARILVNEEKYDSAILYYKKSAVYAEKKKLNPIYKGAAYGELAKLFQKISLNDSAIYYFKANIEYTGKNQIMYMLAESLKALVVCYEKQGNRQKALTYKEEYWSLSDSLFNMNEFNKIKNVQFAHEMNQNYDKIATLTADKEKKELQITLQRKILIGFTVSLITFIILLMIVYIQKKKLHNAYKDLFKRNKEILQSEKLNKELRTMYESESATPLVKMTSPESVTLNKNSKEDKYSNLYATSKLTEKQKKELLKSINYIMENPDEFCRFDFSLEKLSILVGSNSRYVSQVINETYNKNFRTFINDYRIKEAQLRLMNTEQYGNYTIQAIAESVGYKSHTNFIIIFKRITGMPPSIFQKIANSNK